jgi:predicted CopG family antitoxin
MPTTIQLKKSTLNKLKKLKHEKKANSYDEVIEDLIKHELNLPDTLFGFMKGKTQSFQRDQDDEDHEL